MKKHFIAFLVLSITLVTGCADEGGSGGISNGGVLDTGTFTKIASGQSHTCGLDTATSLGTLKCWGNNMYGQLGDGSQNDRLRPTAIDNGVVYSQISVGAEHSCGITWSNVLKCWGRNNFGQLGIASLADSASPVVVDSGVQYSSVSVSGHTSCAITAAGDLKCWGYNGFGSIGDNTTLNRDVPTPINVGTAYKYVSVGQLYTCGITSLDELKCWGNNQHGQLGDGTTLNKYVPTIIDTGVTYQKIATSTITSFFTCGLTTGNKLKCWGSNQYGQLGDGTTVTHSTPQSINALIDYTDISVGYIHACAIQATTNKLFCWGGNQYGQLGDYTSTSHASPVQGDSSKTYSSISTGYNYTCGRTNKNLLRCWGLNDYGQIGDGTLTDVAVPKSIQ